MQVKQWYGETGSDNSGLDNIPKVLSKITELTTLCSKISTISPINTQPHTLDSQPPYCAAVNEIKEIINNLHKYAQLFHKYNWFEKKA